MSELIVNAPIQNRDYDIDRKFGGILPIITADWLARQADGSEYPYRVDLWNSSLASEGQSLSDAAEFRSMMARRLTLKYDGALLGQRPEVERLTDIDEEFCKWGEGKVAEAIELGIVRDEVRAVHACGRCGATLALAEAQCSNGCVPCADYSPQVELVERPALVMSVSAEHQAAAYRMAGIACQASDLPGPQRGYIVNKKRVAGISLHEQGYDGYVLDPKIAIGLLALYAADKHDADEVKMTVGRSSAHHNVGHLLGFLGDRYQESTAKLSLLPIARAPVDYLNHLCDSEVISTEQLHDTIRYRLPGELLGRKRPISPQDVDNVVFSRRRGHILD